MTKVIVLAGGADQIALIQELKERGFFVILIDYFKNPPAKKYADKHYVESTLDIDRVEYITKIEGADYIFTACTDQALLTMAKVSEDLNLPCYIDYKTALNVTNKSYMKRKMVEYNIPTAKFQIVNDVYTNSLVSFNYPLVVKPVDCNSSKGVKRVENESDLLYFLREAIELSRTHTAIVEEFKEGEEISADLYIENGIAKLLSATISRKVKNSNGFTIIGSDYPALTVKDEKPLVDIGLKISEAFNLDNCPLLIQLIYNQEQFHVIEFSARMGGGSKYKLIETLSGVNIMSKYVDRLLGYSPTITPLKRVKFAKMVYIYCSQGIYSEIKNVEILKEEGFIDSFFEYKMPGTKIEKAETSGDRVAGFLIVGESEQDIIKKLSYSNSLLQVLDVEGDDIMLHDLYD